jgi:hypothetical protein
MILFGNWLVHVISKHDIILATRWLLMQPDRSPKVERNLDRGMHRGKTMGRCTREVGHLMMETADMHVQTKRCQRLLAEIRNYRSMERFFPQVSE